MSFRRLQEFIDQKNSRVVVGLDPTDALIPDNILKSAKSKLDAYWSFCAGIIDAVCDVVPAVKPQAAFFERLGPEGFAVLDKLAYYAKLRGLYVILDCKRGDIGSTAQAYAEAYLQDNSSYDAITVNGFLGSDGIIPFRDVARENDKGVFVLVKTSNPSSAELQDLIADNKTIYSHMAELILKLNADDTDPDYPTLGAVVGATNPAQLSHLRGDMPNAMFLIPGYGAQGGKAEDAARGFINGGKSAIVNSSRAIIGAWKAQNTFDYRAAAWNAAIKMTADINAALPLS